MQLRTLHAYVGMLIAPTVLFLATTGLLQVYSLHEDHGSYQAPRALEVLGSLHKDQKLPGKEDAGHHHDHGAAADHHDAGGHADDHKGPAHPWAIALLKVFFAGVAVSLIGSTLVGIWMAWQTRLRRRTHMILLGLGALIPLVLAFLAS
ncbi:MAG TPA: hypothetical protein VGL66_01795 [Caulobacteraceae bacterium]|jgi:hypothetical protein